MRSARAIIVAVVCIFISTNLLAFDGQRAGFILGGGIGAGFLSNKTSFGSFSNTESETVFLTNFKIGYAPSNTLEIYYVKGLILGRCFDFSLDCQICQERFDILSCQQLRCFLLGEILQPYYPGRISLICLR